MYIPVRARVRVQTIVETRHCCLNATSTETSFCFSMTLNDSFGWKSSKGSEIENKMFEPERAPRPKLYGVLAPSM